MGIVVQVDVGVGLHKVHHIDGHGRCHDTSGDDADQENRRQQPSHLADAEFQESQHFFGAAVFDCAQNFPSLAAVSRLLVFFCGRIVPVRLISVLGWFALRPAAGQSGYSFIVYHIFC